MSTKSTDGPVPFQIEEIEREIRESSGRWSLRFSPEFERQFGITTLDEAIHQATKVGIMGLIFYNLFGIFDVMSTMTKDFFPIYVRLFYATPIVLSLIIIIRKYRNPIIFDICFAFTCFVLVIGIMIIMLYFNNRNISYEYMGTPLIVLWMSTLRRINFRTVIFSGIVSSLCYSLALLYADVIGSSSRAISIFVMIGVCISLSFSAYHRERDFRMFFLLRLRESRQNHDLEIIADVDPLTELGNRRRLSKYKSSIAHNIDPHTGISAIMIDIDHFKRYNDLYGHTKGDACIAKVAKIASGVIGPEYMGFRMGGEEFLFLLPDRSLEECYNLAEQIRMEVLNACIPHQDNAPVRFVSVSLGCACVPDSPVPLDYDYAAEVDTVIGNADKALYAAKKSGRNRTSVWPSQDDSAPGLKTSVA